MNKTMGLSNEDDAITNGNGDHNITEEPSTPSLLRIGLSAGFVSLSQKSGKTISSSKGGRYSTGTGHNDVAGPTTSGDHHHDKRSLLSAPTEDAATLSFIEMAQNIANNHSPDFEIDNSDPTILAALTALGGDYSHSSKGVLVNVIDPTTTSSSNNAAPTTTTPSLSNITETPPNGAVAVGAKGIFASLKSSGSGGGFDNSNRDESSPPPATNVNIYSRLTSTFQTNYNSTLHSLPYTHPRTSTRHQIPTLPVRFGLTTQPISDPTNWHEGPYCHVYIAAVESVEHYRSRVRPALRAFVNQIEGSGTTASTPNVSEGSRKKMVSPGGGATPGGGGTPGTPSNVKGGKKSANEKALARAGLGVAKASVAGNFGSRYIIVFVPVSGTGGSNSSGSAGAGGGGGGKLSNVSSGSTGGGGFGGFRGRKGQSGGVLTSSNSGNEDDQQSFSTATTSSSTHDTNYNNSQHHNAAASAALPPGPIAHSSKEIKELYHKFLKDFPNGRTVILGTLMDNVGSVSPLGNQEWKSFLHNLGRAIVDGFMERVRRYDEELRRLDSRRAAFVRKLSSSDGSAKAMPPRNNLIDDTNFDLSHFFLVKESLAFTYEQMQLFEEAKLQYEELSAFLPEDAWRTLAQQQLQRDLITDNDNGDGNGDDASPSDLAMAGDSEGFRHHIKTSGGKDLRGVSQYVPQYMYSREVRLLFQMGTAVDVLIRSKDFLMGQYRNRLLDVASEFRSRWKDEIEGAKVDSSGKEILDRQLELKKYRLRKEADVEAWALSSCWDIKCASGYFFTFAPNERNINEVRGKQKQQQRCSADEGDNATAASITVEEVEAARCLAELIEFAILRLLRLGDLALNEHSEVEDNGGLVINPIRRATSERPADTLKPWEPWKKLPKIRDQIRAHKSEVNETWPTILSNDDERMSSSSSSWIHKAMKHSSTYEETYLELAEAAVDLNRRAGRYRFASRLEDHRAEVLMARCEFTLAAGVLSNNVRAQRNDQWTRAHYWRIFRLSCCQRMSGDVLAYLETLTQSFNPRLSCVAPPKTAMLFQQDLEAIITDAAVAEPRWG